MILYGIKFREKGGKEYKSVIITAENESEASKIFEEKILNDQYLDVDKRTVSWAGEAFPLSYDKYYVIHGNLDELS